MRSKDLNTAVSVRKVELLTTIPSQRCKTQYKRLLRQEEDELRFLSTEQIDEIEAILDESYKELAASRPNTKSFKKETTLQGNTTAVSGNLPLDESE